MQTEITVWPLLSLRTGCAKIFGPQGQLSAIHKHAVARPIHLSCAGFESDQQGDPVHHGGVEKAVHHYASEHYAAWQNEIGDRPNVQNLKIGGFGENLSTVGLTETNVAIGDVFKLGTATIQVSQPRQPCWKLNVRFQVKNMALLVQTCGRTGWYYRVLEPGLVSPSDSLSRVDRPHPQWSLTRVQDVLYRDCLNSGELTELATLPALTIRMKQLASRRLAELHVEDWSGRLDGV